MADPGAPQFGDFQAVRVLNQVGAATIYAARKASDVGGPAYAVKSLPLETFLGAEEPRSRVRQFVGRGGALRAFLADPVPDDDDARTAGLAADLAALGRLLYRLVLHAQPPPDSRAPAPPATPWSALGRTGEGWRQLCNRLLGAGE